MPTMKPTKQTTPQKPSSAPQKTSTGSGSRPGGARYTIESSAPANKQMIRPKQVIGS